MRCSTYVYSCHCSAYLSFMRQSLKLLHSELAKKGGGRNASECGLPRQAVVEEVNVFRQSDYFSGLLLTLKDAHSSSLNPPKFEVFFSPVSGLKKYEVEGNLAKRIIGLEVNM